MGVFQNLGLLWKNRKLLKAASKAVDEIQEAKMKSGIKTTEFWLTAVSQLMTLAGALNGVIDPKTAAVISAVLTGIYGVLRTLAKQPDITTLVNVQNPPTPPPAS